VKLVRDLAARFAFDPAWRVTRLGVAALVVVTLVGLNIRAVQESHRIAGKKAELTAVVAETFPNLKTIYEPAAQAHDGRRPHGEVEVRRIELHHLREQLVPGRTLRSERAHLDADRLRVDRRGS